MNGLMIFGANSLAKLLIELITEHGGKVEAAVVDDEFWSGPAFHGLPLLKYSSLRGSKKILSAVGYKDMRARRRLFERLQADGHEPASYISRAAVVARSAKIGMGNVIMPGVIVEPLASIGPGNLIWSKTLICHEVVIGHCNYVSANCTIGGHSRIGDGCFIGNSSTTIDGVTLADETHVLPGSVLYEDTEAHTKYFGSPARAVGYHKDAGIVIQR